MSNQKGRIDYLFNLLEIEHQEHNATTENYDENGEEDFLTWLASEYKRRER